MALPSILLMGMALVTKEGINYVEKPDSQFNAKFAQKVQASKRHAQLHITIATG